MHCVYYASKSRLSTREKVNCMHQFLDNKRDKGHTTINIIHGIPTHVCMSCMRATDPGACNLVVCMSSCFQNTHFQVAITKASSENLNKENTNFSGLPLQTQHYWYYAITLLSTFLYILGFVVVRLGVRPVYIVLTNIQWVSITKKLDRKYQI